MIPRPLGFSFVCYKLVWCGSVSVIVTLYGGGHRYARTVLHVKASINCICTSGMSFRFR